MGKVKQVFVDLEHEGPDQEAPGFEFVAVVVPVLVEVICVFFGFACAILWCGVAAGRI